MVCWNSRARLGGQQAAGTPGQSSTPVGSTPTALPAAPRAAGRGPRAGPSRADAGDPRSPIDGSELDPGSDTRGEAGRVDHGCDGRIDPDEPTESKTNRPCGRWPGSAVNCSPMDRTRCAWVSGSTANSPTLLASVGTSAKSVADSRMPSPSSRLPGLSAPMASTTTSAGRWSRWITPASACR